jgi:hypothetical protein
MKGDHHSRHSSQMTIILEQLKQGGPCTLKKKLDHEPSVQPPKPVQLTGNGEDHMEMIASQKPCPLLLQPPLFWQMRTLRTRAMSAGVIPHPFHVTVGTFLNVSTQS